MKPLCTLQNLSLFFPHREIFKDVSFTINEGDKIGLIGLNGHGKSSLFNVLAEKLKPNTTVPPFIFDKSSDFSLFYVPQEIKNLDVLVEDYLYEFYPELKKYKLEIDRIGASLTTESSSDKIDTLINEQTALYEKLDSLGEGEIYTKFISYLKAFNVGATDRLMKSLSGGEQRKVMLAIGLSCKEKIVLWDEPTNHLDLETIESFEEELQNSTKTFLIITHDRSLLNNTVDRILHIRLGKINSFKGTYSDYLTYLQEVENANKQALSKLDNLHRRETSWIRRGVSARRTKSKKRIEDYAHLQDKIKELKSRAHKSVSLDIKSTERKTKMLLEAKNISMSFGEKQIFQDFSFTMNKGEKIALMGHNGAGKSTLLKLLLGELKPTSGEINKALDLEIGYFSQKREALNNEMTPWDLIGEGIDFIISTDGTKKHVATYLESFLFKPEELKRPIGTFSGGEKNRLELAYFMKHPRDIWIFDEPTNDLDLETIGILEDELRGYKGALIVVGHDRTFIKNVTDKCFLIHDKELLKFEAGFSQAEEYIEALSLQKELLQKKGEKNNKKNKKEKNPLLIEELEKKITSLEEEIEIIKKEISEIDYNEKGASEKLLKLQNNHYAKEKELLNKMSEWENLNE